AGGIATLRHLPAYKLCEAAGTAEVVAVCDPIEASARQAARQFAIPNAFRDYQDLLKMPDLDAVSICTPNVYHEPITLAAIEAGCHVLCEKPMAMSYAGARRMGAAAKAAGVKTSVNFRYRWIPAAGFVRDLIRGGEIGEIYHVFVNYFNGGLSDPTTPIRWREVRAQAGSGALGDLASHLIDLGRFWIGEFASVNGQLRTFTTERPLPEGGTGQVDVDDAVSFVAEFVGGAQGVFNASRCAIGRGNHQRAEIYGTKGSIIYEIEKSDRGGDQIQLCRGSSQARDAGLTVVPVPAAYLAGTPNHPMIEFVNAIQADRVPSPTFEDGVRCQEVLEAVEISARERVTVKLPLS
ncbi:MAG: Gfo/Idh/MocA family protein, partial [Candidatus Dormibacteraceae bacterium]